MQLPDFVRLFRGETTTDSRPNKHLHPLTVEFEGELASRTQHWNDIVRYGVRPAWSVSKPATQSVRPPNHAASAAHVGAIRRHISKGAYDGRYLIVDESLLDAWPEVFISPISVVEKQTPDGPDIRVIDDYSFPDGASVNDFTLRDEFPSIKYNPPADIAHRIHALRSRWPAATVLLMVGDVSGAFRHVPNHADSVHMFAFRFDGYAVIDLSCEFGWCSSPAYYGLAGSIINGLYERERPEKDGLLDNSSFTGNYWCDDHTCVEVNTGTRCHNADITLRRAMLTVLGPTAINERKFTRWGTNHKSLGLLWNTHAGTVSIPDMKLTKAARLIDAVFPHGPVHKKAMASLLGVLRHIVVCFPPARAFYQKLEEFTVSLGVGRRRLPPSTTEDLRLLSFIIAHPHRFNSLPVAQFSRAEEFSTHVSMDALDTGLCVLYPAARQYIRHKFTPAERDLIVSNDRGYSINIRELQSAVLAATHWGAAWRRQSTSKPVAVRLHIDNMSAVAWANRRAARHPLAQDFIRLLSLAEFQFELLFTAEHIAGRDNTMADAGSRAWDPVDPLWATWTNCCTGWSQVTIASPYCDLFTAWGICCAGTHWPTLPVPSIGPIGNSGADSPS